MLETLSMPGFSGYCQMKNLVLKASDGIIISYSPLNRASFEQAMHECRQMKLQLDLLDLGTPVFLLGILTHPNDIMQRDVTTQEAREHTRSLGFKYREIHIPNLGSSPFSEPFYDVVRSVWEAEELYIEEKKAWGDRHASCAFPTSKRGESYFYKLIGK